MRAVALITAGIALCLLGCKSDPEPPRDAAPAAVDFDCGTERCQVATEVCKRRFSGPAHPGSPTTACEARVMTAKECKSINNAKRGETCSGSDRVGFTLDLHLP